MDHQGELYAATREYCRKLLQLGWQRDAAYDIVRAMRERFPAYEDTWLEVMDCFGSWAPPEHRL